MLKRTTLSLILCLSAGALAGETPMKLPPGHPEIGAAPTSMPASAVGTLAVRAIQKTANGPTVAGDKAIIHFYQGEKVIKHAEVALDAKGEARVDNVPLTPEAVQALVLVQHGQVTYQAASEVMNSAKTAAQVEVPVYETTADAPAWRIPMRHLILSQTEAGVRVVEMLAVDNPSDRTWIGTNDQEKGTTLTVRLPENATNLEIGDGFASESVHFHNGTLYHVAPMTPGTTSYEFAYTIPVSGGKVSIPVNSPAMTQQLIVLVPNDGTQLKLNGLQEQGTRQAESGEMRMLGAAALAPGQGAQLTLIGLSDTAVASGAGWSTSQVIAASVLSIVLLGGIGFMLLKPVKPREAK